MKRNLLRITLLFAIATCALIWWPRERETKDSAIEENGLSQNVDSQNTPGQQDEPSHTDFRYSDSVSGPNISGMAPPSSNATYWQDRLAADLLSAEIRPHPTDSGHWQEHLFLQERSTGWRVEIEETLTYDQEIGIWERVSSTVRLADKLSATLPDNATYGEVEAYLSTHGFSISRATPTSRVIQIHIGLDGPGHVDTALRILGEAPFDLNPEADFVFLHQFLAGNYNPELLWNLEAIQAPEAWTVRRSSTPVVVALIDSGVDLRHPAITAHLWVNPNETRDGSDRDGNGFIDDIHGWDFADNNGDPQDQDGHGTHIAGTIAAVPGNGNQVVGVAWEARLIVLRAGDRLFPTSLTSQAIDYVIDLQNRYNLRVAAINASYGSENFSQTSLRAIRRARDAGILFVAAAGNDRSDNDTNPQYPANFQVENVIAVAATNLAGHGAGFSNWGANTVHLSAPGSYIYSLGLNGSYRYASGTSMAAPHVTGAIALLAAHRPLESSTALRQRLFQTADALPPGDPRPFFRTIHGALNLRRALDDNVPEFQPRLSQPSGQTSLLSSSDVPLRLEAEPLPPGTQHEWLVLSGPVGVQLTHPNQRSTELRFPSEGAYHLRYEASWNGLLRGVDHFVIVGRPSLSRQSLVAEWEGPAVNGSIPDISGSNRNATATQVNQTTEEGWTRMEFRESGSRASFPAPRLPNLTMEAWVDFHRHQNSIFPRIIHLDDYIFYGGVDDLGDDANSSTLKFFATKSATDAVWFTPPGSLPHGSQTGLFHVAVTYESGVSADRLPQLFINGLRQPVGVQVQGRGNQILSNSSTGYLGDNGLGERHLEGALAKVRIHNAPLNPAQIRLSSLQRALERQADFTFQWETVETSSAGVRTRLVTTGAPSHATFTQSSGPANATFAGTSPLEVVVGEAGEYRFLVSWEIGGGINRLESVALTVLPEQLPASNPTNGSNAGLRAISTRARAGSGDTATIAGFILEGDSPRQVIIRALGPSLSSFGVEGTLPDPHIGLFRDGTLVAQNRNHVEDEAQSILSSMDFSPSDSREAALVRTLSPGAYTAVVSPAEGTAGVALVEVIAAESGVPRELVAISTRGEVGTNDNVMIAGFVIEGNRPQRVLIRGIGPALADFAVANPLQDPVLSLYDENGFRQQNRRWRENSNFMEIEESGMAPSREAEAAILVVLPPGGYTAILEGNNGTTGIGLVEVFSLDPPDN